ncbi:MAG: hypothetical protein HZA28_04470 [Candidatus Omnitrophica bacterium]|nr:hypothetical protein [Candidatus Omnitrophota bacterium]
MEFIKGHPLTSEEKLLQLIRKKNNSSARKPPASPNEGADPSPARTPAPPEAEGQPQKKDIDFLSLTTRTLGVVAVGIFIFILINFRPGTSQEVKMASVDLEGPGDTAAEEMPQALDARLFEFDRQTISSRDIFQAPWEKPLPVATGASSSAVELARQLKLVGILLDKDPKAIVEDLTTQQTFFLSPGERIGSAVVAEIREDKVILDFAQERVELVP